MSAFKRDPKDLISESVFNNPKFSDIVLDFNSTQYHLMSVVVQEYAPALYAEFEAIQLPSILTPSASATPDEIIASISAVVSKNHQKKTLVISLPKIELQNLENLLRSMYSTPLNIKYIFDGFTNLTTTNIGDFYTLSKKFGMKEIFDDCTDLIRSKISSETLLKEYQTATNLQLPYVELYQTALKMRLTWLPKDELLEFVTKMSYEDFTELLKVPNLDYNAILTYEMVESWSRANTGPEKDERVSNLLSNVKFDRLPSTFLITHVKSNRYVDPDTYLKALECSILSKSSVSLPFKFALGQFDAKYDGYHLVTVTEIMNDKYKSLFVGEYHQKDGICSFVDVKSRVYVCCNTNILAISENWTNAWIGVCEVDAPKGSMVHFNTIYHNPTYVKSKLESFRFAGTGVNDMGSQGSPIGLFVSDAI